MSTAVRRTLIAALLVVVALSVYGLTQLDSGEPTATTGIVQGVSPAANSQVLQRSPIEIDLETGWDAELTVDERTIPDDQLDRIPEQGKLSFTPGPGQAFELFPAGQNCASFRYWQTRTGPDQSFVYRWCFTVL